MHINQRDDRPLRAMPLLGILAGIVALIVACKFPAFLGLLCGMVVFFGLGILVSLYYAFAPPEAPRCPRCGRYNALQPVERKELGRKKCHGLVTRQGSAVHLGGSFGNRDPFRPAVFVGSTSHQERAPIIRITYRVTYSCRHCSATQTREEVREVEDFE